MKEKIETLLNADKITEWLDARGDAIFPTGHRFEDFLAQYLREELGRKVSIDQGGMLTVYDDDEIPVYAESLPARWWEWVKYIDQMSGHSAEVTGRDILRVKPFAA